MTKSIILLSDGTGNSAAKLAKTNVWRTYQAIDRSRPDQVALYDDGVGTSSVKPLALLGGAFGWGLKRNVLHLYKFLCRNHAEGDRVFAFGFSRGAFTVRMLVGLVLSQGLVRWNSEEELDLLARAAYREYREKRFRRGFSLATLGRLLAKAVDAVRYRVAGRKPYDSTRNRPVPSIAFLGVWDTVDAYGMPIKELKTGIDRFIWPLFFDSLKLNERVERACHALALDDERATFHPLVWDESSEPAGVEPRRVNQVWFAGMHSNVGGGYPDDSLSLVPLLWMLDNARQAGLRLRQAVVDEYALAATPYGRMYDSRGGLSAYYRYAPRVVGSYGNATVVHESVYQRMANGGDQYAPISLPAPQAREEAHAIAWDTVWWRSVAYWTMVALTVLFVVLGWSSFPLPAFDDYAFLLVKPLVDAAKAMTPALLASGLDNVGESPTAALLLLAAIVGVFVWGGFLEGRIHDRAMAIWQQSPPDTRREWFKQSRQRWRTGTALLTGVAVAAFIGALLAGDATWRLGTLAGVVGAVALLLARRRYDARRAAAWQASDAGERPAWALAIARRLRTSPVLVPVAMFVANRFFPFVFAVLLLMAGAHALNRVGFEILEVSGHACRPGPGAKALARGEAKAVTFRTGDPCFATGVLVEKGARYSVEFGPPEGWQDADIPVATTDGFASTDAVAPGYMILAVPLRRDLGEDWFKPIAHVGEHGRSVHVLGGKTSFVEKNRSGELFLFVNDAIVGVPGLWDHFYRNNRGEAAVTIRKTAEARKPGR